MVDTSNQILKRKVHSNNPSLHQHFELDLTPNLLLQIMAGYQLKAADVIGDYKFNPHIFHQLINAAPYNREANTLEVLYQLISFWPEKLSWPQFNHRIHQWLLAWLNAYKAGATLD